MCADTQSTHAHTHSHTLAHIADCAESRCKCIFCQASAEEYLLVVDVEFVVVVSAMSVCISLCVCMCVFAWVCLPWHIVASHLKKLLIFTHFIFGATTASCRCPLLLLPPSPAAAAAAAVALTTWNIVSALKRHHAHN